MAENERERREGFLSRWSERKRAVREADAAEEQAAETAAEPEEASDVDDVLAANRAAAEAIDLESLTAESDFAPFFKAGVPAALKSAALRKLWRSHPVFACLDGLNDYDENFADPNRIMKVAKTSWEVGSGYAKRLLQLEEEAKELAAKAERAIEALPGGDNGPGVEAAAPEPPEEAAEEARETAQAEAEETEAPAGEEAEPNRRVPLRGRVDFAAFKSER